MRYIAAIAVAVALLALALPNPADAKLPRMTISSDHLTNTLTTSWPDTVAFLEAAGSPRQLAGPPGKLGPKYEVMSWYWQRAVGPVDGVHANDVAFYYPHCSYYQRLCERGVVRVLHGDDKADDDVWLELGEERDAILRRYVTLSSVADLPEEPAAIELFAAAAVLGEEDISVEVDGRRLNSEAEHMFWEEIFSKIGESRTYEYRTQIPPAERMLITLHLPEKRTVTVRYVPWLLCFCPEPTGSIRTATVRREGVPATPLLNGLLDKFRAGAADPPRTAAAASPAERAGEALSMWALFLIAGGASVSMVGAGVSVRTLRRRNHAR